MATHRYIDRICLAAVLVSLLLTVCFLNGEGIRPASGAIGYETRLFDTAQVHTVDIIMDGWEEFLAICENEEYTTCAVVIDGEAYRNVGLRAKGNTSLSLVSSMGSSRYSFKLEFDHYESGKTYYGLDKLCLNNVIQDNTYMKDYLTYRLMAEAGAAAPLCSFVRVTVNGQDWGLYLAVEGVEESFLLRNYGAQQCCLYKPDSTGAGGRGNGQDFRMEDMENMRERGMPPDGAPPEGEVPAMPRGENSGPGGIASDDVKLKYTDDRPESYENIFAGAKTEITGADETRLIRSFKKLGEGEDLEEILDMDAILRYFAVHNFVVNGDSYTGSMVHNYYLYEEDGRLAMIPWDYNLAFGTFQSSSAASAVNDPIDSPLSVSGNGDRPMMDWILTNPEYTALYHRYIAEFLETVDPVEIIDGAYALIAAEVERDPTKFCTYQEFEDGVEALKTFCILRRESISGQLAGTIPPA